MNTSKHLKGENIYDVLKRLGWVRVGGNSRLDFYKKKNWMLTLSNRTDGMMRFTKSS